MPLFYSKRRLAIYGLVMAVVVSVFCAAAGMPGGTAKWVTTAGLLLDVLGLIQLEVSGFFGDMLRAAHALDGRGEDLPSYLVREIIDNPDEERWRKTVTFW